MDAHHGGVGAGRHGVDRQRLREAQMGAPGLVDHERQAAGVGRRGDTRYVGAEAVVARRGHDGGARQGVTLDGGDVGLERHVHGHPPVLVDGRLDVHGHRAGQDEAGQQRLMGVARHDDLVARSGGRHDQGLQAAARTVGHEERALGAPGLRRELFGAAQQTARLLGVVETVGDAHVGRQKALAERVYEVGRGAGAELVTRRVEGRRTPLAIGTQRLDERRLGLAGPCHIHIQYLAGGGDVNAALNCCLTLWLPHLGHSALDLRSSMWQVTSNLVPHFVHLKS